MKNRMLQSNNKHIHTACHSQSTNFNYSLMCIITAAARLALVPISFHPFELRLFSDFQGRIKIRRKTKPIFIYATCVFPYTSFSCFLLRTKIDCCGYTLSILLSTFNYDTLSSPYPFPGLGDLRGLFCQRCLHEIANLCATYGHHMLLLLLFVLLPLQSHFTSLPSEEKKIKTISAFAPTKG